MNTRMHGRAVLMSMLTLATPSLALAQGVSNGTFATPQAAAQSPWIQYYPSGILDPVADPGVRMLDGRLRLLPRIERGARGSCPPVADIAVLQHGIDPMADAECKEFVELEFDMRINLESAYSCPGEPPVEFGVLAHPELPALRARVWEGAAGQLPSSYSALGEAFEVSTADGNAGWLHYRATWRRNSTDDGARYMVTLQLGDLGEGFAFYDEASGEVVYLRPNQANLEIDNVQLTARASGSDACTLLPPGAGLDQLGWDQNSPRRPVGGGTFSGTGPDAACEGPGSSTCAQDLNGDGAVSGADLGILLGAWGTANCLADLNGNGVVEGADLGILLGAWGACDTTSLGG